MVIRLLLSLAFDVFESEEDAEGLRALRRIMVCYFLNSTKRGSLNSKYASFTLTDLVIELSQSERTKKRMDLYVTTNPSGTAAGGMFRDKVMEHCVRCVKCCLRGTHGLLDDIKLEKEIGGLSIISNIVEHNRSCVMRGKQGKQHCHDMVGPDVKEQLEENVAKYNPFSRKRLTKHTFVDKPSRSPFKGLTNEVLDKFVENKKREYRQKY